MLFLVENDLIKGYRNILYQEELFLIARTRQDWNEREQR